MSRRHEWSEFGKDHVRHGREVPLTLKHPGKALEVGLQPVLLRVLPRRFAEVADHLVELVLQHGDLAARLDAHLPREIALGDRGRDLGDCAHLTGQIGGQLVDVVGQVLPDAGDLRRLRLAAELALDADLARDSRDLGRKPVELVNHRVHRVLEFKKLALDISRDLFGQIAVGNRRRDFGDIAYLSR